MQSTYHCGLFDNDGHLNMCRRSAFQNCSVDIKIDRVSLSSLFLFG